MATLKAPANVSPAEDAERLYKACKGWGTDEKTIIQILGHRNAWQRRQIRQAYHGLYQEDLVKRLESELHGDFEKAVCRWILDPADRDAVLAHAAVKKSHPDINVIIEISCSRSPEELLAVRRAYQARYKRSLEEDVAVHTSGEIRKLLVALVSTFRYDGDEITARLASSEAKALHEALKDKGYDRDELIRILSTRSKRQLMATFNCYRDAYASSVTKELLSDPDSKLAAALLTTVRCLNDPVKYYEKVIRKAVKGLGTDEDALTRVIVTRAEKDMKEIKERYYRKNSVPLEHAVAADTSGDYEAFLLALLGKKD